jgi:hypothetical protein
MPRVEVQVRVIADSGEEASRATFGILPRLVSIISEGFSPQGLANYLGGMFRTSLLQSRITLGVPDGSEADVTTVNPEPTRPRRVPVEEIQRQIQEAFSQVAADARFRTEYMGQFSPSEGQVLPESVLLEDREDRVQEFLDARASGSMSARFRQPPPRGVREHAIMLDDAAHFDEAYQAEATPSDTEGADGSIPMPRRGINSMHEEIPLSRIRMPDRNSLRNEAFRQAYGTSGIESIQFPTGRSVRITRDSILGRASGDSTLNFVVQKTPSTPKEPEDRSGIPTRYQRKPVI